MTDEGSNKNKTISFRVEEQVFDRMKQSDHSLSELYRGMTDMYLGDSFFQNGVNSVLDGTVDSFSEYAETYFEAAAEHQSAHIAEVAGEGVQPEEIKEPLRDYLAAVNFGDKDWAESAAEDFYDVDESLGDLFTAYTERFSESQWDQSLR